MFHKEISGPVWTDHCEHPVESYVCSFEIWYSAEESAKCDLYVYPDDFEGQHVCIREGDEGHQYRSPGGLFNVLRSSNNGLYKAVAELLVKKGYIKWEPKV